MATKYLGNYSNDTERGPVRKKDVDTVRLWMYSMLRNNGCVQNIISWRETYYAFSTYRLRRDGSWDICNNPNWITKGYVAQKVTRHG